MCQAQVRGKTILAGNLEYHVRAREEDVDGAWELRPYDGGKILKVSLMCMYVCIYTHAQAHECMHGSYGRMTAARSLGCLGCVCMHVSMYIYTNTYIHM